MRFWGLLFEKHFAQTTNSRIKKQDKKTATIVLLISIRTGVENRRCGRLRCAAGSAATHMSVLPARPLPASLAPD